MPEYQSEPKNIRMSHAKRLVIAKRIKDMLMASETQKGSAPTGWWKEVWAAYLGVKPSDVDEGFGASSTGVDQIRMPHGIRPRTDALNAQMCTVIGRQEPYMTAAEGVEAPIARKKEKSVHRLWQDAGFRNAIAVSGTPATLINKALLRVYPEYGDYNGRVGCCIDAIHPKNFFPFPASVNGRDEWSLVSHQKWARIGIVKSKMRSGQYYDVTGKLGKKLVESSPDEYDETGEYAQSNTALANSSQENDSRTCRLFMGQVRLDLSPEDSEGQRKGEEKWYRFVLAYDSDELLALSEYGFTDHEYFDLSLLPELLMYWGGDSIGRSAYPLQDMGDKLWSTFYTMAQNAAKRFGIGPPLTDGSTHIVKEWGEYWASEDIDGIQSMPVTPELGPIIQALQEIQRLLDINFRISQNTMGSIQGRDTKATTDSIIAAGVEVGIEQLIANFTSSFPAMARHTEEIALHLYADLKTYYQDAFPATPEELEVRATWEVTGRSPNSTPTAKIQHAMTLIEAAMDPEYGFNKYKLGTVLATQGPLAGTEGIQFTEQEMQQRAQAMAAAEDEAQQKALDAQEQIEADKMETEIAKTVVTKAVESATKPPEKPQAKPKPKGKK